MLPLRTFCLFTSVRAGIEYGAALCSSGGRILIPLLGMGEKTVSFPSSIREAASDRAIQRVWIYVDMWIRCE